MRDLGSSSMASYAFVVISFFLISPFASHSAEEEFSHCKPLSCGRLTNISYPFSNSSDCRLSIIHCVDDSKAMIELGREKYEVLEIFSNNKTIRIRDSEFIKHLRDKNCDELSNFTKPVSPHLSFEVMSPNLTFFICNKSVPYRPLKQEFLDDNYRDCGAARVLFFYDMNSTHVWQFEHLLGADCDVVQFPVHELSSLRNGDLLHLLEAGFDLQWSLPRKKGMKVYPVKIIIGVVSAGGTFILSTTIIICWLKIRSSSRNSVAFWKKKTKSAQNVEEFLRDYGPLIPKRYKFSDVKKMTESFKNKLGQGGYGGVFKGKLLDGYLVAVKVLSESKGNGEEFINEVASISRTSHVNIVTLLGFCVEGPKRALIYKFMPNGSLEKLIYDERTIKTNPQLGWERLYQIAVGIARGLEYLHRGCNTRILHFDIKPHNILLDEDFCPKIADFGLAKLCPRKESIISMAGARGTPGYIAPEVFSRSFGGVSHKSDVYSYGMMVLEMVGGRKNIEVGVDNTSEIYFPHWIYNHLHLHKNLGLDRISTDGDEKIARKMIIVGLWSIQTNPYDRPSMSKVLEMLEGDLQSLPFPPKPFISSPSRSPVDSPTK